MIDFPLDTLPPRARGLLKELPRVVGSRPEYGALGILWATALCAPKTKVEIKESYRVGINLYGAIVAPKGDAKSPALGFTVGILIKKIESDISAYQKRMESWDNRLEILKRDRTKGGQKAMEDHLSQEPKPPWWGTFTMGTSEGIRDLARQNASWGHPAFIGQFSEELDSWVKAMGKYAKNGGDGGEMGFYLQAYDGDVTIKANKAEKNSSPKFRLGLLGTIQPKVFRDAFHGKIENGLMDRFVIVTGKGESKENIDPYAEFTEGVVSRYDEFISELWEDEHPEILKMPENCLDKGREMYAWLISTDKAFKCEASSKWWVHFHKVTGILTVLWGRVQIDQEIMDKAIELTKYLVTSWCMSFRSMSLTDVDEVEKRITEILRQGPSSKATITRQITASQRNSIPVCLESMEEDGIIIQAIDKGSNGRQMTVFKLVTS